MANGNHLEQNHPAGRPTAIQGGGSGLRAAQAQHTLLAPIALFVFNRPQHTLNCLRSLAANPEFAASPLFIFCDGPRNAQDEASVAEVRRVVTDWPHARKTVVLADSNRGLADSIISGVTQVIGEFGHIIVVEDDLVLAPGFLGYMNRALQHYRDHPQVMQVAGHMYPVPLDLPDDAVFLPVASSWGWATWGRAWRLFDPSMAHFDALKNDPSRRHAFNVHGGMPFFSFLERQRRGQADSWFIRWYLSIFTREGIVLYPRVSLVRNGGFDGTGVHCGVGGSPYDPEGAFLAQAVVRLPSPEVNARALAAVSLFMATRNTFWQRALRRLRGLLHPLQGLRRQP